MFRKIFMKWQKDMKMDKEGGERCFLCYEMRLREAAEAAKMGKVSIILPLHFPLVL